MTLLLGWNGRTTIERIEVEVLDAAVPPVVRAKPKRVLAVFRHKGLTRDFHHYEVIRGGWIEGLDMDIGTGGTFAVREAIESPPLEIDITPAQDRISTLRRIG